jgi:putative ABC transport system ATP-binding protein
MSSAARLRTFDFNVQDQKDRSLAALDSSYRVICVHEMGVMTKPLIELSDLGFSWPGHPLLLDIPAFRLEPGETLFLKGPSGSGKTTLLGLLGGVQRPDRGSIRLLGQELTQLSAGARDTFRVDHTGYIFQQFNLLPFLSVRENVELPCHFSRLRAERAIQRHGSVDQAAATLLAHLGLKDQNLLSRRADSLSIGQQQRVAAARALIGQPELVIADEPTSALDYDARENFIRLLFAECREAGSSLLFVSHDQSLAPLFDRHLSLAELNRAATPEEV